MPENDQSKWVGIRTVNPAENIPVTESTPLTSIEVEPTPGSANFPVTESAPLTSIKVSPLLAGTLFNTETQKRTPAISDLQAVHSFIRLWDHAVAVAGGGIWRTVYTVPADYIFIMNSVGYAASTGSCTRVRLVLTKGVTDYQFNRQAYNLAQSYNQLFGVVHFDEAELFRMYWENTAAGDNLDAWVLGFLIKKY